MVGFAGVCLALALLIVPVAGAVAQEGAPPLLGDTGGVGQQAASIVLLDRQRLFEQSLLGKASIARLEAASVELIAENRRLEAALEEEERALTARRATLEPAEFRRLAGEFDTRVEDLRLAQDAKSRALTRSRDEDQQRFFAAAVPVLGALMQDIGAVVIIDNSAVILSFERLDITDQAIARLDAELGDGAVPDAAPVAPSETPGMAPPPDAAGDAP